jgi:hypothetical protein
VEEDHGKTILIKWKNMIADFSKELQGVRGRRMRYWGADFEAATALCCLIREDCNYWRNIRYSEHFKQEKWMKLSVQTHIYQNSARRVYVKGYTLLSREIYYTTFPGHE